MEATNPFTIDSQVTISPGTKATTKAQDNQQKASQLLLMAKTGSRDTGNWVCPKEFELVVLRFSISWFPPITLLWVAEEAYEVKVDTDKRTTRNLA